MSQDVPKLVKVFDDNAQAYDRYRPRYPQEAIEDIIELSHLQKEDPILEIGCGTGQITLDFLQKGYPLTAIEKGAALADFAAANIAPFKDGKIITSSFEDWQSDEQFSLILSAQAFHWIEKKAGLEKILSLLKSNGALAWVWNLDRSQSSLFWEETNPVYKKYFPSEKKHVSLDERAAEYYRYLQRFRPKLEVLKREYAWAQDYSKNEYLGLLSTFSNHMTLEKDTRDLFFGDIGSIIDQLGGTVTRYYSTVLILGRYQ